MEVGEQEAVRLCDYHAQVFCDRLCHRLGKCLEVGLPGFIFLREPFEASFDERRSLPKFEWFVFAGHGDLPSDFPFFVNSMVPTGILSGLV
jgi:hypothetical protein